MLNMALFRDNAFVWAMVAAVTANLMLGGILFVLPQYLQAVQGADVFDTGLRLIPMLLGLMAGAVATDRVSDRAEHKPIIVTGLLVLAASAGACSAPPATATPPPCRGWSSSASAPASR